MPARGWYRSCSGAELPMDTFRGNLFDDIALLTRRRECLPRPCRCKRNKGKPARSRRTSPNERAPAVKQAEPDRRPAQKQLVGALRSLSETDRALPGRLRTDPAQPPPVWLHEHPFALVPMRSSDLWPDDASEGCLKVAIRYSRIANSEHQSKPSLPC
jgi:hypothetical protein